MCLGRGSAEPSAFHPGTKEALMEYAIYTIRLALQTETDISRKKLLHEALESLMRYEMLMWTEEEVTCD